MICASAGKCVEVNLMSKFIDSESKHFKLQMLAEGIYTALAADGGAAICNAGLVDLGGQVLVFDTFLTPQAAKDLRKAAVKVFGRAPQIVINSHYHNDHTWGNQVFAGEAQIFSSTLTRDLISTSGMEEYEWHTAHAQQRFEALQTAEPDVGEGKQAENLLWLGYYAGLVEALPHLILCKADVTFNRALEIHGTRYTAKLITYEGAHTGSDSILHIPEAGIIYMSDLLFVGCHPYLGDGDPDILLNVLKEVCELNATCLVPGHGSVGTIHDVKLLIEYIDYCFEVAKTQVKTGRMSEAEIKAVKLDDRFRNWIIPQFFQSNIQFLCTRFGKKGGG